MAVPAHGDQKKLVKAFRDAPDACWLGSRVVIVTADGTLAAWSPFSTAPAPRRVFFPDITGAVSVSAAPSGLLAVLVQAQQDTSVRVFDTVARAVVTTIPVVREHGEDERMMARLSADGEYVAVAGARDDGLMWVTLYRTGTGEDLGQLLPAEWLHEQLLVGDFPPRRIADMCFVAGGWMVRIRGVGSPGLVFLGGVGVEPKVIAAGVCCHTPLALTSLADGRVLAAELHRGDAPVSVDVKVLCVNMGNMSAARLAWLGCVARVPHVPSRGFKRARRYFFQP